MNGTELITLEDLTKLVQKAVAEIKPSEGRVTLVLNVFATAYSVDRFQRPGRCDTGLTSADCDSPAETVAGRLLRSTDFWQI